MRRISGVIAVLTLVASGAYTAVSLARWEWTRALFFGLVFVAAELWLVAGAVLGRLAELQRSLDRARPEPAPAPDPRTLEVVRAAGHEHDRFPWLQVEAADVVTRTNVFITLVVGGGVLLSGGAWVLDKLGSRTVDPGREAELARDLSSIAYPDGLLIDDMVARARSRPDVEDDRLTDFLLPRS
ncbi:hypothetical protein ACE2AJ_15090 [Aquihabitans daechungensis]|uniref:hypothetical protein n=1 Tax=Aquihabitans daechungensis TaxID=1052257 RepID=UPI003B9F4506